MSEHIEDYFGEGFAKPIRFFKALGSVAMIVARGLARPHTLASHGDHFQKDNPREELHRFFEEARKEHDAHDFDMGDDLFMRHSTDSGEFHLREGEHVRGHIILPKDEVEKYFLGELAGEIEVIPPPEDRHE